MSKPNPEALQVSTMYTLYVINESIHHSMKPQIFSTEVLEDQIKEIKAKKGLTVYEGEVQVTGLDEDSSIDLRFFTSFGKARDCITDLLRIRIQAFKDLKNEFHAVRVPDIKKLKL